MNNWSINILHQSGWDLWVAVCVAASLVLLTYAWAGGLRASAKGRVALALVAVAVLGTAAVVCVPALHRPDVGIGWTFVTLAVLSVVFYLNLVPKLSPGRMAALLVVRLIALALVVLMLFGPALRYLNRPKPERPLLFLVDASGSMSFPDVQNGPTRMQSVWQTLRPQLPKVRDHFVPQFFTFATDLKEIKDPEEFARLVPDGKATDVGQGLAKVLARASREDSAVVLVSDGIDNTSPDPVEAVRHTLRPIHTVLVGSEQSEPASMANVAVENVETSDDFVVRHESKVKATIKSTALANRVVDVKMAEIDAAGKPAGEITARKLVLQSLPEGQTVDLPYKPTAVGVRKLAVWIDPIAGERSTVDNRQEFQGLALDPRIRVLYVEGRLRPEYKPLKDAMERDQNVEVATLLQTTEGVFKANGKVDGEDVAKANFQMPQTPADWKKFDVILLGDLPASFLSRPQQAAIEQAVGGGAGLLMIGGQKNLGPGEYQGSDVEKALPVFVGPAGSPQEKTEFVPRLTAEGAAHPVMEGLAEEWFGVEGKAGAKTLPPLRGNVVVRQAKSGATVLLTHADRPGPDGKPQIVLAVQRYGQGRSAAFTADTTYLWYLPLRGMGQESPYNRFWGQLVRWLAGEDVRNRQHGAGVEGLLNKSLYQLGEGVHVRAMVRDPKGDATRFATVSLSLKKTGDKDARQVPMNPAESRTGMYDAALPNPEKGDYTMTLVATKDGKELGRQELKFTVIPPADEMLKIAANPKLMERLALEPKAAGTFRRLDQFPALLDELIRKDAASLTAQQETVPLDNVVRSLAALFGSPPKWDRKYDLPTQALVVLVLLVGEWLLRRQWQLP